jgi:hypothetical protein
MLIHGQRALSSVICLYTELSTLRTPWSNPVRIFGPNGCNPPTQRRPGRDHATPQYQLVEIFEVFENSSLRRRVIPWLYPVTWQICRLANGLLVNYSVSYHSPGKYSCNAWLLAVPF